MCNKCGKNKCSGNPCSGGTNAADLEQKVLDLEDKVAVLEDKTKWADGHPIWMIDDPDDLALFDFGTGKGFNTWDGWAVCNGAAHLNPVLNKNISTPNLIDRFVVAAGGTYSVGDIGGSNSVQLTVPELPVHKHTINDPGHVHVIDDPGHTHAVNDPGHGHASSTTPHKHLISGMELVMDAVPDHSHTIRESTGIGVTDGTVDFEAVPAQDHAGDSDITEPAGAHTPTGIITGPGGVGTPETDVAAVASSISDAFTGVALSDAFTGITADAHNTGITETNNEGADQSHENRPPYFALIFIKKIY